MRAEARHILRGRFAVNGDNARARIVDVFDIARDGQNTTVVLLRYPAEDQLVMRTIFELFRDFSVFSAKKSADNFIAGHRSRLTGSTDDDVGSGPDVGVDPERMPTSHRQKKRRRRTDN